MACQLKYTTKHKSSQPHLEDSKLTNKDANINKQSFHATYKDLTKFSPKLEGLYKLQTKLEPNLFQIN